MPSLSDLQKFKASFHDIGGQKADLLGRNLPFDDLELPAAKPKTVEQTAEADSAQARSAGNGNANGSAANGYKAPSGKPEAPPKAEAPSGADEKPSPTDEADDLNFGTFLGTRLDDLPPPPIVDAEPPGDGAPGTGAKDDAAKGIAPRDSEAEDAAEFYTPPELLFNLSEELDSTPPDFLEEEEVLFDESGDLTDDTGGESDGFLDSDDPFVIDDIEEPEAPGLDAGDFDGFGLTGAEGGDTFDLGDLDGIDLPDEPFGADEAADSESDAPDIGDLGDFGLSDDPFAADVSSGLEGDGLDLDDFGDIGLSDDPFAADASSGLEGDGLSLDDLGDFGLSDDPFATDASSGLEGDGLSLDDLGDFGLSDDPFATDASSGLEGDGLSLDDLGDFGLSDDSFAADASSGLEGDGLDLDDLGDLGLSDDPFPADASSGLEGDGLSLDDLGDFGLSDDPFAADASSGLDSDGLNLDDLGDIGLSDDPFAADAPSGLEGDGLSLDDLGDFGLSDDPFAADASSDLEGDGLDLDDLGDLGLSDDPFATDAPSGLESDSLDLDDLSDFGASDDPFAADASSGLESDSLDLGDMGDFGVSDDPFATDASSGLESDDPDLGDLGDFGLSDDPFAADTSSGLESDSLDLGDMGDFGVSDDPFAADELSGLEGDGPDLGDLGDFGVSDDPFAADASSGLEDDGLDLGDFGLSDDPFAADASSGLEGDGLDMGDFGVSDDPFAADGSGDTESGTAADAMDDFSFPDLDSALEKSKAAMAPPTVAAAPAPGKKIGLWGRQKPADAPPPGSLDEIKISKDDLRALQGTLAGYPLNLRIACQEIIAEQDVSPEKMSKLITHLVQEAPAKETAALAGEILDRKITIPKGFEKSSGEALEAEKSTFGYIFVNSFLPVLRMVLVIGVLTFSIFYLAFTFVFTPLRAERIYRRGYELIHAGDFQRANERFAEAFNIHRNRNWFYRYAEAFLYHWQLTLAEQKYEMLLRYFPRDRRGVLDFAAMQTNYRRNYARADQLLRREILDFNPNDFDALLAAGQNSLAWAEEDPSQFDSARISFARLLEVHGWEPVVVEWMMKYFIRTDNLGQVLHLRDWFDAHPRRTMQATTLSELGGYLLDKQFEDVWGVPNEFLGQIRGVPDILREAMELDPSLPEPFYHLSRFYRSLGQRDRERVSLEYAIRAFDNVRDESVRRRRYRVDAHQRYADVLINDREFMAAERQLLRGVTLYEDGMTRRWLAPSPEFGRLFAGLGDLEFFVKTGDMEAALNHYRRAAHLGWAPPEMRFRMGAAYYNLENWGNALEHFFIASRDLPQNRRVLFALGNAALKRGDFHAAQGFYGRLLDMLENQRSRLPILLPNDRPEYLELAERLMMARNNAGVASEMLSVQTGDLSHRHRAMALYSEAQRAWDARHRDPATMIRSGGVPLPHLNMRNALHPQPGFEPQIFIRIDMDADENSPWERLAPQQTTW